MTGSSALFYEHGEHDLCAHQEQHIPWKRPTRKKWPTLVMRPRRTYGTALLTSCFIQILKRKTQRISHLGWELRLRVAEWNWILISKLGGSIHPYLPNVTLIVVTGFPNEDHGSLHWNVKDRCYDVLLDKPFTKIFNIFTPAEISATLPSSQPGKVGNTRNATRSDIIFKLKVAFLKENGDRIIGGSCKGQLTCQVVADQDYRAAIAGCNLPCSRSWM